MCGRLLVFRIELLDNGVMEVDRTDSYGRYDFPVVDDIVVDGVVNDEVAIVGKNGGVVFLYKLLRTYIYAQTFTNKLTKFTVDL